MRGSGLLVVALTVLSVSSCVTLNTDLNTDQFDLSKVQQSEDCQWWVLAPVLTVQDRATLKAAVEELNLEPAVDYRIVGHEDVLNWYVLFGKTCINAWVVPK